MFEKIVLRRAETGTPISAGQLAEALLFYQNVHVVIDHGSFVQLVRQLGIGLLISLLRRGNCSAVYCEETLGTHSHGIESWKAHSFAAFTLVGHEGVGMFRTREERVAHVLGSAGVSSTDAKRFAKLFLQLAPTRKLSGDFYLPGGITAAAHRDLHDGMFMRAAVNAALGVIPGAERMGASLRFDVSDSDLGQYVIDNVDYAAINKRRAEMHPALEPVTVAHFLSHVLEARADLALAAFYGGDFASSTVTSAIVETHFAEILRRSQLNHKELSTFHSVTLVDYPSLRETIDSGQRTFKDFLLMLDGAAKFKDWLKVVSADEGLIRSYMTDISKQSWVQSVPSKSMRYLFTLALEAYNPIAGVTAAIADNFIIEKLLGGWRPNHFVENRLRPFVESDLIQ